jgi:hypothetical protein
MPEFRKKFGIGISPGSQLCQSSIGIQHQGQSGTAGHGLVQHCPAMIILYCATTATLSGIYGQKCCLDLETWSTTSNLHKVYKPENTADEGGSAEKSQRQVDW